MNGEPNIAKAREQARAMRARVIDGQSVKATPVVALAEALGYEVTEFEPTDETQDICGAIDRGAKKIFVNRRESAARKRFTIAHEIGHAVLHDHNEVDFRQQIGYTPDQTASEREANVFATELLMPRLVFEALWNAYEGSVEMVARTLQVSRRAAAIRADELKLGAR